MGLKVAAAVALTLAQLVFGDSGMLLHKTLFGPCAYLGAPCAPKNTVCTIYPAALEDDSAAVKFQAFLHSQAPERHHERTKRQIGGFGGGGLGGFGGGGLGGGGFGGGGLGGGGFNGLGGGSLGGAFGGGFPGIGGGGFNGGGNSFRGGGQNFNGGGGGQSFGGGQSQSGGSAVYGGQPQPQPPQVSYQPAPAPEPAPASYQPAPAPQPAPASYQPAPAPEPAPASYGAPAPQPSGGYGGDTQQTETNIVVQAIGGYGETTDKPVVINEETVVLPGTEEEQAPEYKYDDERSDVTTNKELQSQKEIHSYTVQKHRINKKIYNVHRTHQHEHINTKHVLNLYRHNHPHTQTEYVTYVHNKYVPKKYIHYSRTDVVQDKGTEEHPTTDVVQKTVQAPPEYAPVEVVQTGYDNTPLVTSAPPPPPPPPPQQAYSGRRKREAALPLQAICMCAQTFVPVADGCDCPTGKSVDTSTGRCV